MLSEPEDYGLSPEATLAHTITGDPPERFEAFWSDLREDIAACPRRPVHGRFDDGDGEIVLRSVRGVRVSGRLVMPEKPPRSAVLSLHGANPAAAFDGDWEAWTDAGIAVLELRVRGYPPSTADMQPGGPWIHEGIDASEAWIVRGAVGDVAVAARAMRHAFPDLPLTIRGESLGGGLAVIGAAQLTHLGEPPTQLLIGLPTFGDWAWRAHHFANGLGGQVNMLLQAYRSDELHELRATLALFDAAWHARTVTCPAVCKLALRDDTVPAPTAAAVFNALGANPRRAFVVAYGHYDGGLADLRRHAAWDRLTRVLAKSPDPTLRFLDTIGLPADGLNGLVNSSCVRELSKI